MLGPGTWCFHELLAGIWMGPTFLKSVVATCIKVKNAHKFLTKEVDFWCLSYRNNNWAEKDIHTEGFLAVWSVQNGYTRLSTSRHTWISDTVSTEQSPCSHEEGSLWTGLWNVLVTELLDKPAVVQQWDRSAFFRDETGRHKMKENLHPESWAERIPSFGAWDWRRAVTLIYYFTDLEWWHCVWLSATLHL